MYKGYVYQITNETTGQVYIGQSVNQRRFESHINNVIQGGTSKLYKNMREYGLRNFNFKYLAWIELPIEEDVWMEIDRLELHHWSQVPPALCLNSNKPSPHFKTRYFNKYKKKYEV